MSSYRMDDGTVVRTENATKHWNEDTHFDGRNMVSNATGSQWKHETLYRSKKGRYYIEHDSQWQGDESFATWLTNEEAVAWLVLNGHDLPKDLQKLEDEVCE